MTALGVPLKTRCVVGRVVPPCACVSSPAAWAAGACGCATAGACRGRRPGLNAVCRSSAGSTYQQLLDDYLASKQFKPAFEVLAKIPADSVTLPFARFLHA